ncbi:P-loop containing nucleoside triphosphate hydrolase protein [Cytidiella melzeri]|nr:P-loop containing nucleoside triphosphate hydrolase protein [Cytidiella melzeri]
MRSSNLTATRPLWADHTAYDWEAPEGIAQLQHLLCSKVPYELAERQLICTAKLLKGQHIACVWATGDGKSSVFYLYSLVRPQTMTIVVAPTNALEEDMVNRLQRLGITAVAINRDALNTAESAPEPYDLWAAVKDGTFNIVLLSPEMLKSKRFKEVIQYANVRSCLGLFCVDECHLIDEWGADFRQAYGLIAETIPWLPTWTARLGLTATLEPGRQTDVVMKALGFHDSNFFLDRRDCERHNVDIIFRPVEYTSTTDEFHDLDWLIPPNVNSAAEIVTVKVTLTR